MFWFGIWFEVVWLLLWVGCIFIFIIFVIVVFIVDIVGLSNYKKWWDIGC